MAESESAPAFGISVYHMPSASESTSSGSSAAYMLPEISPSQEAKDEAYPARYCKGLLVQHSVANTACCVLAAQLGASTLTPVA